MIDSHTMHVLKIWSYLELIESMETREFRKINEKYFTTTFGHDYSKIEENCSSMNILETLPSTILFKILSKVIHKDLISIAIAFPGLKEVAFSSTFWKQCNGYLDELVITREQLRVMFNSYGNSLESLNLNSTLLKGQESEINLLVNLRKMQLVNIHSQDIIRNICDKLKLINDIKLEYTNLDNNHIDMIRSSLTQLRSFCFGTNCNVNKGICELINNLKYIQKFGLKAHSISEKTIELLLRIHKKSLIEIYISSKAFLLDDSALKSLNECKNLRSLLLSNIRLNQPLCDLIDSIDNLENFMFGFHDVRNFDLHEKLLTILKKPNFKLKKLNLIGFTIRNQLFDSIFKNCPNLNTLILDSITFLDCGRTFDTILQNLEILNVIRTNMFTANHLLRPLFNGRLLKDALKIKQIVLACYKDTTEMNEILNLNIMKIQNLYDIHFIISKDFEITEKKVDSEDSFVYNYLQIS